MAGPRVASTRPTNPGEQILQGAQLGAAMVQFGQQLTENKRQFDAERIWTIIKERSALYPDGVKGFFADEGNKSLSAAYFDLLGFKSEAQKEGFIQGIGRGATDILTQINTDIARRAQALEQDSKATQEQVSSSGQEALSVLQGVGNTPSTSPSAVTPAEPAQGTPIPNRPQGRARFTQPQVKQLIQTGDLQGSDYVPMPPTGTQTVPTAPETDPAPPDPVAEMAPVLHTSVDETLREAGLEQADRAFKEDFTRELAEQEIIRNQNPSIQAGPTTASKDALVGEALDRVMAAVQAQDPTDPKSLAKTTMEIKKMVRTAEAGSTKRDRVQSGLAPLEAKYRPIFGDEWEEVLTDVALGRTQQRLTIKGQIEARKTELALDPTKALEAQKLRKELDFWEKNGVPIEWAEKVALQDIATRRAMELSEAADIRTERGKLLQTRSSVFGQIASLSRNPKFFDSKTGQPRFDVLEKDPGFLQLQEQLADVESRLYPDAPRAVIWKAVTLDEKGLIPAIKRFFGGNPQKTYQIPGVGPATSSSTVPEDKVGKVPTEDGFGGLPDPDNVP